MVWVCITLAIPLLLLLSLHLLRFRFSLDLGTPATARGTLGVSFLWFNREMAMDAGQALAARNKAGKDDGAAHSKPSAAAEGGEPHVDGVSDEGSRQRGAVGLPDSWLAYIIARKVRLRAAARKWLLDFGVWRLLLGFLMKSGRRILGLLHPALEYLHLGMENVYTLGRIAAAWSVVSATIPFLACPTEFGFNEKAFAFRAKLTGGFTGLQALLFGLLTLFSFPWSGLAARFIQCWRDPKLNLWQRRVLLP